MEPVRNFRSIINSVPFTFLVGPSHTKLTVQSGLARHVSRPLDHLMNSGQTRESKHQIAVLEDEDVETFVAFCEYAYTGDYGVPPPGLREDDREPVPSNNPFKGIFSGNAAGGPSPAPGLAQKQTQSRAPSHERSPERSQEGFNGPQQDTNRDTSNHGAKDIEQNPPAEGEQAADLAPPQDLTLTPGDSDASPTPAADVSLPRGRRRRKRKNEEKVAVEDPTPKLTPPCTPPPGDAEAELADLLAAEPAAKPDEFDGEPELKVDQSPPQSDTWEQSVPTAGNRVDGNDISEEDNSGRKAQRRPVIDTSFANQEFSPRHEKGTASLWDEFAAIDDADLRSSYCRSRPSGPQTGPGLPYLIFHAKLYVFATRYLIPELAHLCLRKLHRDLLTLAFPDSDPDNQYAEQYVLTTTKARMVLDLLHYTYSKTTRLEPISLTSATQLRENELRRLVVHYAACKVRDLAEYCPPMETIAGSSSYSEKPSARGLRALLDTMPELASDLIYRMI